VEGAALADPFVEDVDVEVWLCLLKAPLNPAEKSFALGSLERSLFRSVGLMSAAAVDSLLLKPPAGTPKPA